MRDDDRPNILIVMSDQLSQKAVGAYGNCDVVTPNMDRLAAEGLRFENVYTPCPLCQPMRPSLWTGLLPHEHGVLANRPGPPVSDDVPTMGDVFSSGGYETVHFGKRHDRGGLRGFWCAEEGDLPVDAEPAWPVNPDTTHDRYATVRCIEYLEHAHERPFLMVADLTNPHNICGWIGQNAGPHEDVPIAGPLPELPANFEIDDLRKRPLPIQYLCCSHRRLAQASRWSEDNYRHYLAAYYHFTNRVDSEIGRVLAALDRSDAAENTLIVFLADHGEGMAAHRMVTKQIGFYEEMVRVPLIFAGAGVEPRGAVAAEPLVSSIDVFPTLCEIAGIESPAGLRGRSLGPHFRGQAGGVGHPYVVSEWETEFGYVVSPGRMVRTPRHKYTRYLEGDGEELYDLQADPGETRTLVDDPAAADLLFEHRRLLDEHLRRTDDDFASRDVRVDPRWRTHEPGYPNHRGPTSVDVGRGQAA